MRATGLTYTGLPHVQNKPKNRCLSSRLEWWCHKIVFLCFFFRCQYHQYNRLETPISKPSLSVMTKIYIHHKIPATFYKETYILHIPQDPCMVKVGIYIPYMDPMGNTLASFVHHTTLPIPSWSSPGAFNSMTSLVISLHFFGGGCEYQSHATYTLGYSWRSRVLGFRVLAHQEIYLIQDVLEEVNDHVVAVQPSLLPQSQEHESMEPSLLQHRTTCRCWPRHNRIEQT